MGNDLNSSSNVLPITPADKTLVTGVSIADVIYNKENRELSRIGKVEFKFDNIFIDILCSVQKTTNDFFIINKKTTLKLLFHSAVYVVGLLVIYKYLSEAVVFFLLPQIELKSNPMPLVATFMGIFAYQYTLFNNKWKYTADLYNKIYVDQSFSTDNVGQFRKRCLLALDTKLQGLEEHNSFSYEYSQTVIMAAIISKEKNFFTNGSSSANQIYEKSKNGKFINVYIKPEELLHRCIVACEDEEFYLKKEPIVTITSDLKTQNK